MTRASHKTLITACGVLANEFFSVRNDPSFAKNVFGFKCLSVRYQNFLINKIVPKKTCFKHYKRLGHISKAPTDKILDKTKEAEKVLEISFDYRRVCIREFTHV